MNAPWLGVLSWAACLPLLISPAQAAEGDAKPDKVTIRAADGLSIVGEVSGKGDTAVVLLHGWCCTHEFWKQQIEPLAADYRVVAIDQAGHGESGKDRDQWSVDGLGADVQAVVKELGLKRVILVGHSMGGPVALAAAKRMPGTVVAVIGVDTLHNAEFDWPEEQTKMFLDGFERDFVGTMRAAFEGMLPEGADSALREWISSVVERQNAKMGLALMRDMAALDQKKLMKEAGVPVRCINAGSGFQFAMPTDSEINRKYCDFRAVIMEGVGHFPMLEKPAEFNERLREMLKEFAPAN